jgi:hypothetical protein
MNKVVEPDELGAQLGQALRNRVATQRFNPPEMGRVRAGAKRRRALHRGGVVLVCVALVAAAGLALTRHVDESVTGGNGGAGAVRPPMLPAYAVLDGAPGVGQPVSMWASTGAGPMGVAIPQTDVWQAGDQRLVIRSVDNTSVPLSPAVTTTVVATTAATTTGSSGPWAGRSVTGLPVRGVDGAIEALAADQFAVWIPTPSPDKYTLVIGRGLSRDEVLADVNSLVDVDGVLQPSAGFTLVERAKPLPPTTPAPAFASVSYSHTGSPIVTTYSVLAGWASIETASWYQVGRVDLIAGRQVMFVDGRLGNPPSVSWLDPSGAATAVSSRSGNVADLIPFVHMVTESDFIRQGDDLSHRLTQTMTKDGIASVGDVTLTRRHDVDSRALCVTGSDAREACVARPAIDESPGSAVAQALINGHWVIYGYREILPDEAFPLTTADLKFTSPDGSCCTVDVIRRDNAYWYVVHVDDGVDVVDTNLGNVFGGLVGSIARPLVASTV